MANYVVDASIIGQYFITQLHTTEARAVVKQMLEGDQLHIPEFSSPNYLNSSLQTAECGSYLVSDQ